jgi:hypothetical protein
MSMLAAERDYLLGEWTLWKFAIALLVPAGLGALGRAFWKRSMWYGMALINAMVLFKIGWTFVFADAEGALLHLLPAAIGLGIVDATIVLAARWFTHANVPREPLGVPGFRPDL